MTLLEYAEAYQALMQLMDTPQKYADAYNLVRLKRALEPDAMFFAQKERELMEQYAKRDERGEIVWSGTGRFVFAEPSRAGEYATARRELAEIEPEGEFKRQKLNAPESITPRQLEALLPFADFGGGRK